MRFIGDYSAKVDAKGRVFLPSAFRKVLKAEDETSLMLREDVFQKCHVLYPQSVWNTQLDDLRRDLRLWNKKEQMMLRQFVLGTESVELDKEGRLLISKQKLQFAEIGDYVRFLAMIDRIEIWSKQALDELMADREELGDDLERMFGQRSND